MGKIRYGSGEVLLQIRGRIQPEASGSVQTELAHGRGEQERKRREKEEELRTEKSKVSQPGS